MKNQDLLSTIQINQYNTVPKYKCIFCKQSFRTLSKQTNIKYYYGRRPRNAKCINKKSSNLLHLHELFFSGGL